MTRSGSAENTALVLVDFQEWILDRFAPDHGRAAAVEAEALRVRFAAAGLPVFHVQYLFLDGTDGGANSPMTRFVAPIQVQPEDLVLTKYGISCFYGADIAESELQHHLRRLAVSTVVVAGVTTDGGVAGTARDAVALGYQVVVAASAVASKDAATRDDALTELEAAGVRINRPRRTGR